MCEDTAPLAAPPPVSEHAILRNLHKAHRRTAATTIGDRRPEHPLERCLATRRAFGRQLAISGAVLAGVLIATALTGRASAPLTIGAVLASFVFALLVVVATASAHAEAIDATARGEVLIVADRAPHRLSALTSPSNRRALARTLGLCLTSAPQQRTDVHRSARATLRSNPELRPQITEIIWRLQDEEQVSAVAVALVHQLISDAGSPLYAGTPGDVQRSLRRIRYLLATGDSRSD